MRGKTEISYTPRGEIDSSAEPQAHQCESSNVSSSRVWWAGGAAAALFNSVCGSPGAYGAADALGQEGFAVGGPRVRDRISLPPRSP